MDERRGALRRKLVCEIQCESDSHTFAAEGLDLSETGVSFATAAHLHVGDTLTLHYRPEETDPLMVVRVKVQHITGTRVGAEFISPHTARRTANSGARQG